MAEIKVLAGDFGQMMHGQYFGGVMNLPKQGEMLLPSIRYELKRDVVTIEEADEQSVVKVGGAVGWGAVGVLAAGPLGLLAGALLGGRGKKVVFVAEFKDGKRLMGEVDKSAWIKMKAAVF